MKKFLSTLTALVLLVTLVTRPVLADDGSFISSTLGSCSVGDGCSCDCTCTEGKGGAPSCTISKDCPCLEHKGIWYYVKLPFVYAGGYLCDDWVALGRAVGQFTWGQNIFNAVALLTLSALMFRN